MFRYFPLIVFLLALTFIAGVLEGRYLLVSQNAFLLACGVALVLILAVSSYLTFVQYSKLDQQVQEQKEHSRLIIENHPDLIIRMDDKGKIKYINPKMEKLSGKNRAEMEGKHWGKLFLPEEDYEDLRSLDAHFQSGYDIQDYDLILRTASGRRGFTSWTSLNIFQSNGRLEETILFGIDVTQRNEYQGDIIEIKEQYERLVEDQLDPIVQYTTDGTIIFANKACAHFLGCDGPEELVGENLTEYIVPGEKDLWVQDMEEFSDEYPVLFFEHRVLTTQDRIRITHWTNRAFFNYEGEIRYIQAIIRDITQQRKAQERLRAHKEKNDLLAHAIESSTVGITIADAREDDLPLTYVNKAFLDITGYEKHEVLGRNCRFLQGQDTCEKAVNKIREGVRDEKNISVEILNYRKDGSPFWNIFMLSPVRNEDGDTIAFTGVQQDVSARKKYEQELRKARREADAANQAKSEFLANMSHEIRTPMNGIIGTASLLKNRINDSKELHYLDIIMNSGDQLLTIINDILDFSKIEAGELRLSNEKFSLSNTVKGVYELFRNQAESKNLDFSFHIDSDIPEYCIGDSGRLRQVLTNFLSNALKFTAKGSVKLSVKLIEKSDKDIRVIFKVTDTGIGIREEKKRDLFQKFSQVFDLRKNANVTGTGLGLSITKSVVETMGGEVGVDSEYGKGSAFYAILPLKYDERQNQETPVEKAAKTFSGKVLLVEDVQANQMVIRDMLEDYGLKVDTASNGQEGVEMESGENYDLIFMDLRMPVMDGIQATGNIRMHHKDQNIHVPVIALTAHAMDKTREEAQRAGMDDFLTKPLKSEVLGKVLLKWLGNKNMKMAEPAQDICSEQQGQEDFDFEFIKNIHGKDPDKAEKFAQMVLNDIEARLPELDKAISNKNYEDITSLAHALKSAALQAGGLDFAQSCRETEEYGRNKKPRKSRQGYKDILKKKEKLEKALMNFLAQE